MRLDHVAHPCRDSRATHRFYSKLLGLQLVQAYAGKELMLIYALPEGGGSLVFSTGSARPPEDGADWESRHVGLVVATREEFDRRQRQLTDAGISFRLIDDERVYFSDPDGLVLELELASPVAVNPAAADVLARWRPS